MRTPKTLLSLTVVAVFVAGCAPDEGELCEHLQEIYADKPNDRPKWLEDIDSCVDYYEGVQNRYGVNTYRREAECLQQIDTVYKARTCMEQEKRWRQ